MSSVALVHAAATLGMAGLIWFVQVVHYPQFGLVGDGQFAAYERGHIQRTNRIVAPLMLAELVTALFLVVDPPFRSRLLACLGLALLLAIWLSTALVQVPCHRRLQRGFDAEALRCLVATNWIRTAAWTARAGVALALVRAASTS